MMTSSSTYFSKFLSAWIECTQRNVSSLAGKKSCYAFFLLPFLQIRFSSLLFHYLILCLLLSSAMQSVLLFFFFFLPFPLSSPLTLLASLHVSHLYVAFFLLSFSSPVHPFPSLILLHLLVIQTYFLFLVPILFFPLFLPSIVCTPLGSLAQVRAGSQLAVPPTSSSICLNGGEVKSLLPPREKKLEKKCINYAYHRCSKRRINIYGDHTSYTFRKLLRKEIK